MIALSNLGIFAHIATSKGGSGRDTLQLTGDGTRMCVGGRYYAINLFGRLFRRESNRIANNGIRTKLLENLARTFGYEGVMREGDRCRFTEGLMERLEQRLGKGVFERDDFGIDENGYVASGSPLTERRITAIVNRVHELNKTGESERKLKADSMRVQAMLSNLWIVLDGEPTFSPLELAKFIVACNRLGSDVESIGTKARLMAFIERETGRTCHLEGVSDEEVLEQRRAQRNFYSGDLVRIFKHLQEDAEKVIAAYPKGVRVSMREAVRAEDVSSAEPRVLSNCHASHLKLGDAPDLHNML